MELMELDEDPVAELAELEIEDDEALEEGEESETLLELELDGLAMLLMLLLLLLDAPGTTNLAP